MVWHWSAQWKLIGLIAKHLGPTSFRIWALEGCCSELGLWRLPNTDAASLCFKLIPQGQRLGKQDFNHSLRMHSVTTILPASTSSTKVFIFRQLQFFASLKQQSSFLAAIPQLSRHTKQKSYKTLQYFHTHISFCLTTATENYLLVTFVVWAAHSILVQLQQVTFKQWLKFHSNLIGRGDLVQLSLTPGLPKRHMTMKTPVLETTFLG